MERPVGQIFTGSIDEGETLLRAQVVFIKTLCLDEVPCRHCMLNCAKKYYDPCTTTVMSWFHTVKM